MNSTEEDKRQFWVLLLIALLFLLGAPSVWHYTPDGGIYIGTAKSMVETGQYRFNGYPNLLYYPGFPSLLSLPIMLFGVSFHILHFLCAAIVVFTLWLARVYFPSSRYGLVGIAVPILLACTKVFQEQVFSILSDGTFLAVSLGALLLWRIYMEESHLWALVACFFLVAFAPLVRFQGLFLSFSFAVALFLRATNKDRRSALSIAIAIALSTMALIPFAAWTWRNFHQFTPHTFNMANQLFFGQEGLELYAPEWARVDWIDAEWKYPIYSVLYSIKRLGVTVLGTTIVNYFHPAVVTVSIIVVTLIGSLRWFKLATKMERVYVGTCIFFVLVWLGRSRSLYSPVRQFYLPFLPFILISAGFGLTLVYEKLKKTRYQALSSVFVGFLVVLVLSNGVTQFFEFVYPKTLNYYRNANQVMAKVKHFIDENAKPGVSIATVDWGVLPFILNRQCYQVLNDESHLLTLKRIKKYETEYLVILDRVTPFALSARKMVDDLPQLFTQMLEVLPDGNGPTAAVYGIDLKGVNAFLDAVSKQ